MDGEAVYSKNGNNNKWIVRARCRQILYLKTLLPGILIGFALSTLILHFIFYPQLHTIYDSHPASNDDNLNRKYLENDSNSTDSIIERQMHGRRSFPDNTSVADTLYNEVKILCWVMTNPNNHKTKAISIRDTWGKRCNKILFMSTAKDDELDTIVLQVKEGREFLWNKLREAFKYVYNHHIDDYDWFLRADDDTYVVMENLRYMLYPYSADMPIHFGYKFKPYAKQGYFSGGAGVVLSKEAVRKFVIEALPYGDRCKKEDEGADDVEIGKCLEAVNVVAGDTRDSLKRSRFLPFVPEQNLFLPPHFWFHDYSFYEIKEGYDCCSNNVVSFHYIDPHYMHVLEYFIYHLRPYGILYNTPPLGEKLTKSEFNVMYNYLKSEISTYNGSFVG